MKIPRILVFFALVLTCLCGGYLATTVQWNERLKRDQIALEDIPPSPVLSVSQALESMHVQPGFVLETVAAEPDVFSPVALAFDGDGRLWVCEFMTYMPNVEGENEEVPRSTISILEDRDGDGLIDTRTVFLENVILPRAIAMVEGGILYADHTQLYFAEVLDGDRLGRHEVVDATYAQGGNIEHKPNGMLYGMDNWYYNASSDLKYKTLPLTASIPAGSEEIYRNAYWKMVRAPSHRRGQWGLSMDDYGRLFYNGNSSPAMGEPLRPDLLGQNPDFVFAPKAAAIGETRVYPVRINPGVNRGYVGRDTLISDGPEAGRLSRFTAAGGNVVYRGDNFPAEFYGMSVTPEPAGNLISARRIIEKEATLSGEPFYARAELLASTDERFRPVNLFTAPDGTLYVVDMYHGIIQHKAFLTDYLKRQILARDLDQGNNTMGRIYRLRWEKAPAGPQPRMRGRSAAALLSHLGHPNGWWRDTARRLIVQSGDKSLASALVDQLEASTEARAQINMLWTLEGLGQVDLEVVRIGLASEHEQVRAAAIAVTASVPSQDHAQLLELMRDHVADSPAVTWEVALNAGSLISEQALEVVAFALEASGHVPYVYEAALSGSRGREAELAVLLEQERHADFFELLAQKRAQEASISGRETLSGEDLLAFDTGHDLYHGDAGCAGCHGPEGQGLDGMGPPLVASEWVLEQPERLAKVMLHGLVGPITVNGVAYDPGMMMPGLSENEAFDDAQLAAIATYIRNNWGNGADPVPDEVFARVRRDTRQREQPYEAVDLP